MTRDRSLDLILVIAWLTTAIFSAVLATSTLPIWTALPIVIAFGAGMGYIAYRVWQKIPKWKAYIRNVAQTVKVTVETFDEGYD